MKYSTLLLILIFLLTGCKTNYVVVKEYVRPAYCGAPDRPELEKEDEKQNTCSSKNIMIKKRNMDTLITYSKMLEETKKCYEAQVNKIEEDKK